MATKTKETKTVKLPAGIDQETYDKAKEIIVSGFKAKQDENAIKSAMFQNGIVFSDLVRLYKAISIGEGLVLSPKEIKAQIEKAVIDADVVGGLGENIKNEDIEYENFVPFIEKTLKSIKGATEKKVVSAIRKALNEEDLEMPKKPKKGKGGSRAAGKINTAIVNLFAENKDATAEDFKVAMEAVTTEKSVKKWCRMYKLFASLATGKNAEEGLA
jgi:hypothetical protein